MMPKEWSINIVNVTTRGSGVVVMRRGHMNHKVKMYYFFQNRLLCSQAYMYINQTKYKV